MAKLDIPQVALIAPPDETDMAATRLRRSCTALLILSLVSAKSIIGPLAGERFHPDLPSATLPPLRRLALTASHL